MNTPDSLNKCGNTLIIIEMPLEQTIWQLVSLVFPYVQAMMEALKKRT